MIKNIFNPGEYPKKIDTVLLLLRLVGGLFMLTHGMGKFTSLFSVEPIQFPDPIGIGATASLSLAVLSEVFCAIFLIQDGTISSQVIGESNFIETTRLTGILKKA